MLQFLRYMLQLIISPKNGWADILRANIDPKLLLQSGLYPLLGATAITCFFAVYYQAEVTLVMALQQAIVVFISYFITYFLANLTFSTLLNPMMSGAVQGENAGEKEIVHYESDDRLVQTFVLYNVAILASVTFLRNILPIEISLLQVLPLGVVFIMWRGVEYLNIPEKRTGQFMFLSVFSILVPAYLFRYLFQLIIM